MDTESPGAVLDCTTLYLHLKKRKAATFWVSAGGGKINTWWICCDLKYQGLSMKEVFIYQITPLHWKCTLTETTPCRNNKCYPFSTKDTKVKYPHCSVMMYLRRCYKTSYRWWSLHFWVHFRQLVFRTKPLLSNPIVNPAVTLLLHHCLKAEYAIVIWNIIGKAPAHVVLKAL